MSFGDILNQFMKDGIGGQTQAATRVQNSATNLGQGGSGIEGIFAQIQGALAKTGIDTSGAAGTAGGFADKAKDFFGKEQAAGLSGAQIGGIGAMAGALLGGGIGGAAKGGALAMLGTLALGALRNAQAKAGQPQGETQTLTLDPREVTAVAGPDAEKLLLRAMISAAKADGEIDQTEMQNIISKISVDSVTEDEKAFVMAELRAPVNVSALTADVQGAEQAAEVYAASLIAMDVDTDAEKQYLRDLAQALRLDQATVQALHKMTGAPHA